MSDTETATEGPHPPVLSSGEPPTVAAYRVTCPSCHRFVRLKAETYSRVSAGETGVRCSHCSEPLDISTAEPEPSDAAPPSPVAALPHSGLHSFGWLLVTGGAIGLIFALVMDTSVESASAYGSYGSDRVHNLGLLARQVVVSIASGLTLVTGAVFVAAGYLSDLRDSASRR
jgi:hypothetical protein